MIKIVEKPIGRVSKTRRKLDSRQVVSAQGKRVKAGLVNPESASFSEDLLESFARSVARARRENKLMTGHGNGDDDKG
ncbi:hypothetical protein [Mesorhizobium helmanticense]|uniref:Uncharacterized protein n=1 Tax=Mesorhizobium helmanticense TaxID=1776423 RepID=A0A2T4IWP2_9HYPH|nr:hypothetical protein [Mesorhizobium helmanticense]PTE10069.1 hypothetical protein C9427_13210 [Mesorhizobium helmanticense]